MTRELGNNLSHVLFRFKEGLSALGLYNALQLYPALLSPVLCHVEKQLTAEVLENLFRPDLSPLGSNRRAREGRTLGFWADYLLDCEGLQNTFLLLGKKKSKVGLAIVFNITYLDFLNMDHHDSIG